MKILLYRACCLLVFACTFFSGTLYAKPERVEIKSESVKLREAKAEALMKSINLSKVEDPDTRLALETILYSIGLHEDEKTPGKPDPHLSGDKGVQDERPL